MKKIKVQSRISPITFGIVCAFGIVVLIAFIYLFANDPSTTSNRAKYDLICLIGLVVTVIAFGFKEVLKNDVYVAEFIFANGQMQIVYRKRDKVVNVKTIDLSDITDFTIKANMNYIYLTRGRALNVVYTIVINSKTHGLDTFHVEPSKFTWGWCAYQFLLDMISISKYIPNFSYTVNSEDEEHKRDIDYFKVHGKRLPLSKRKHSGLLIFLYTIIGISMIVMGISLFYMFSFSFGTNSENQEYVQNYRAIDDMRNSGDYKGAIERVEYLKTIEPNDYNVYLYEAYIYEVQGQYEKEIESTNKALQLIESGAKSRWDETFGNNDLFSKYIFKSGNENTLELMTA